MEQEFQAVIRYGKKNHDCQSRSPARRGIPERFGQRAADSREDGTEDEFGEHRAYGCFPSGSEIHDEKDRRPYNRARQSRLPVPLHENALNGMAEDISEDGSNAFLPPAWRRCSNVLISGFRHETLRRIASLQGISLPRF